MDSCPIYKLLFLIAFTLVFITLTALDLDMIYDNIIEKYQAIETYQADFVQENYWSELEVNKISKGKVYYNKNYFLLSYSNPEGQFLLLSDNILTLIDLESNQMLITDNINQELRPDKLIISYWQNSIINFLLSADKYLIMLNIVTELGDSISVQLNDYLIKEFSFTDSSDNCVTYKFSNALLNMELSDSFFVLKIPEDIDIIDNRQQTEE